MYGYDPTQRYDEQIEEMKSGDSGE